MLFFSVPAYAHPYDLYAEYERAREKIRIQITDGIRAPIVVPQEPLDAEFKGIFLHPNLTDSLSKAQLDRIDKLEIHVCNSDECRREVPDVAMTPPVEILPPFAEDKLVLPPSALSSPAAIEPVSVRVYAKLKAEYLCERELAIRLRQHSGRALRSQQEATLPGWNFPATRLSEAKIKRVIDLRQNLSPRDKLSETRVSASRSGVRTDSVARQRQSMDTLLQHLTWQNTGRPRLQQDLDRLANGMKSGSSAPEHEEMFRFLELALNAWSESPGFVYGVLVELALETAEGEPVLYSFCTGVGGGLDWDTLAYFDLHKRSDGSGLALEPGETPQDGAELAQRSRKNLYKLLEPDVAAGLGELSDVRFRNEPVTRLCIMSEYRFFIGKDWGNFALKEVTNGAVIPFSTIVDRNSSLKLDATASRLCTALPNGCCALLKTRLEVRFRYRERDAERDEVVDVVPEDDHTWRLPVDLSDKVGQRVTFRLMYKVDGASLELLERTTRVENIGVVTTFPVVTDVLTAVSNAPKAFDDPSNQSSLPVSWALNLTSGGASHVAITFPWMIGVNTRELPRLANIFKLFPHVSVVFPLAGGGTHGGGKSEPAAGVGVALASVFTFSAGWTFEDPPQAYLLTGLSITDIPRVWR